MKVNRDLIILCWINIVCCWTLKLLGSSQFDIPELSSSIENNQVLLVDIYWLLYCLNGTLLFITLLKKRPNKKQAVIIILINTALFINYNILSRYGLGPLKSLIEISTFIIAAFLFTKDKKSIIETLFICLVFMIYQFISAATKGTHLQVGNRSFMTNMILQIDYYMLILITANYALKKGGYLYENIYFATRRGLVSFMVFISKRERKESRIREDQAPVQKEIEPGYIVYLIILSFTQVTIVATVCYFVYNTIINFAFIFFSFVIMRARFKESYHAETILKCTTLGTIIFYSANRLSFPVNISTLSTILVGSMLAYLLFIYTCYNKMKNKEKELKFMTIEELRERLPEFSNVEIDLLYDYWHRDHTESVDQICKAYGYTKMKVYRLLKKIK